MRKKKKRYYISNDGNTYKTATLIGCSYSQGEKDDHDVREVSMIEFEIYRLSRTVKFVMLQLYNLGRSK